MACKYVDVSQGKGQQVGLINSLGGWEGLYIGLVSSILPENRERVMMQTNMPPVKRQCIQTIIQFKAWLMAVRAFTVTRYLLRSMPFETPSLNTEGKERRKLSSNKTAHRGVKKKTWSGWKLGSFMTPLYKGHGEQSNLNKAKSFSHLFCLIRTKKRSEKLQREYIRHARFQIATETISNIYLLLSFMV